MAMRSWKWLKESRGNASGESGLGDSADGVCRISGEDGLAPGEVIAADSGDSVPRIGMDSKSAGNLVVGAGSPGVFAEPAAEEREDPVFLAAER